MGNTLYYTHLLNRNPNQKLRVRKFISMQFVRNQHLTEYIYECCYQSSRNKNHETQCKLNIQMIFILWHVNKSEVFQCNFPSEQFTSLNTELIYIVSFRCYTLGRDPSNYKHLHMPGCRENTKEKEPL